MQSSLGTVLESGESGLFHLVGDGDIQLALLNAKARGYRAVHLDCGNVGDKKALLSLFEKAFSLPPHFGHNWDALTDCLMDLSWLQGLRWALVVEGLDRLSREDPESYYTLLEVLLEVSAYWADQEQPFIVLLREDCGPEAAGLPPVALA